MDNTTIIQYPLSNTDKLIEYYGQTTEPIKEILFDYIKLQKDYLNAFQLRWVEIMKNNVMLYSQMCNAYLKNIYYIKTN